MTEKIELLKRIIKSCEHEQDSLFDYPVSYGYNLACENIIKIIENIFEDYPYGKNDWQE